MPAVLYESSAISMVVWYGFCSFIDLFNVSGRNLDLYLFARGDARQGRLRVVVFVTLTLGCTISWCSHTILNFLFGRRLRATEMKGCRIHPILLAEPGIVF
ncbi:hypothetical protein-transmembrane prediction [Rhodopirellula baltica SH 1]|uniref:Uncharacterized protein n=1 Tax=Rhodopirellula baltica (strain DSM 10527 / NCIMB 13988 / SH1) TaxID=243090 RepID=Q7ULT8_RHOBA|nr:hypothetical protein-transmembrane prediction [Rhodopirellula baltica SH 1]